MLLMAEAYKVYFIPLCPGLLVGLRGLKLRLD